MLESSIKRINEYNNLYNLFEPSISVRPTCLTFKQYELMRTTGNMWNLNKQAGKYWFNDLNNNKDKYYNVIELELLNITNYRGQAVDYMLNDIKYKMGVLDNTHIGLSTTNEDISVEHLTKYLPLLSTHQKVHAHQLSIGRWNYTKHIDINRLEDALGECDMLSQFMNGHLQKENIPRSKTIPNNNPLPIDGNNIMNLGWSCFEYGLHDEAFIIFKTLYNFGEYINSVITSNGGAEQKFIKNDLNIISTVGRHMDLPRYMLSVGLGLGAVLKANNELKDAKKVYNDVLKLAAQSRATSYNKIFYWTGLTRVIEAGLELYEISTEVEKNVVKSRVLDIYRLMRTKVDGPNNTAESVGEALLMNYMMINTLYDKENI